MGTRGQAASVQRREALRTCSAEKPGPQRGGASPEGSQPRAHSPGLCHTHHLPPCSHGHDRRERDLKDQEASTPARLPTAPQRRHHGAASAIGRRLSPAPLLDLNRRQGAFVVIPRTRGKGTPGFRGPEKGGSSAAGITASGAGASAPRGLGHTSKESMRPHPGADLRGINKATGAGHTGRAAGVATDSGRDPQRTNHGLSEPRFSLPKNGVNSRHLGNGCTSAVGSHALCSDPPDSLSCRSRPRAQTNAGGSDGYTQLTPYSLKMSRRETTDQEKGYLKTQHGSY